MHFYRCTIMSIVLIGAIQVINTKELFFHESNKTMNHQNQMNTSYQEQEVIYPNTADGITLAGTLTLPDSHTKNPAVILVPGYGPHDRDVTAMGHKLFKVIAEHLTSQGIAVLRYDKRGIGKSAGDWTAVTSKELAGDVLAGIEYLKTRTEIRHDAIGLIGLSEGGLIAAMVGVQSRDINFVVLMAPYVALGVDNLIYQSGEQLRADGASAEFIARDQITRKAIYTIAQQETNAQVAAQKIKENISDYLAQLPASQKLEAEKLPWAFTESNIDMWSNVLLSVPYQFYLNYDPSPMLESLKVPLLALAGGRDPITSPNKIVPVLTHAFEKSGHKDYTIIELPNLNHSFQTCKTGSMAEYATIKETIAPIALKTITDWILKRISISKEKFMAPDQPSIVARKALAGFLKQPENEISCTELTGGSDEGTIFKCTYQSTDYVVKLFTDIEFGKNEIAWTQHASDLGIGPKFYYADPSVRYMIIEFVKGDALVPAIANIPAIIKSIATILSTSHHTSAPFAHVSDMFERIHEKYKRVHCSGKLKDILENGLQQVKNIKARLKNLVIPSVPCHNDLHSGNIFVNGNRMILIDWGDAALGNPYYDIAAFLALNCIRAENEKLFFEYYDAKLLTPEWHAYIQSLKQLVYFEFALNLLLGVQTSKNELLYAQELPKVNHISDYLSQLAQKEVEVDSEFLYKMALASLSIV